MKIKFQRIDPFILFLSFLTFFILLSRNTGNAYIAFLYLFFSVAVSDICFGAKQEEDSGIRAVCWMILNVLVGLSLAGYVFYKTNKIVFGVLIAWMIFSTILNIVFLKKK